MDAALKTNAAGCHADCDPVTCAHDDDASVGACICCERPVAAWMVDTERATVFENGDVMHGRCPDEEG